MEWNPTPEQLPHARTRTSEAVMRSYSLDGFVSQRGLLDSKIVQMTARFQLLRQPARSLATARPGLRSIFGVEKFRKDGWIWSSLARSRLATNRRLKLTKAPFKQ